MSLSFWVVCLARSFCVYIFPASLAKATSRALGSLLPARRGEPK
jgi:hypothetical protein